MKKALTILLSLAMVLTMGGCAPLGKPSSAPDPMASGSGILEFTSSESQEEPGTGETPSAVEPSSSSSQVSSSSSTPSSSKPPVSSSAPASSKPVPPSSSSQEEEPEPEPEEPEAAPPSGNSDGEVRAVWLSYLDLGPMLQGKSKASFTNSIGSAFDQVKAMGLNTVYVQVRPYGDALYASDYFPASYLYTGTEGEIGSQPFDALAIMVSQAHNRGLMIEAWLNPYRVRTSNKPMSSDNPAQKMLETGDALRYDGGIYYNPGSKAARALIVNGVKEIVDNYNVDGIHFDDYFYPPNATADFDADSYAASGSGMSLGNWRREQVNILVKQVYNTVGSGKTFGISPAGNNSNNYNSLYCDVAKWLATPGYVDYICPQIYFGFENSVKPYKSTVKEFNNMISASGVKLYLGLASYKIGDSQYGGEWSSNTDMMARQVEYGRTASRYGGFVLYRYDSLFNPAGSVASSVKQEIKNLKNVLS